MKTLSTAALIGAACITCACQTNQSAGVVVDERTALAARLENAPTGSRAVFYRSENKPHSTLHRELRNSADTVLFAYDADIRAGKETGSFNVTLRPVKDLPTFATAREVTVLRDIDEVRVELLEDAKSHQKIVDVLRLRTPERTVVGHVIKVHNDFFRWVHSW